MTRNSRISGAVLVATTLTLSLAGPVHAGTSKASDGIDSASGRADLTAAKLVTSGGVATATITMADPSAFSPGAGVVVGVDLTFASSSRGRGLVLTNMNDPVASICDVVATQAGPKFSRCSSADFAISANVLTLTTKTKKLFPKGVSPRTRTLRWVAGSSTVEPGRVPDRVGNKAIKHRI